MYNYVFWSTQLDVNFCNLTALNGVKNSLDLHKGLPMKNFPKNASFAMDPNFPKAIKLADCVHNLGRHIVVSKRLKEFIKKTAPPKVEYLPVSIINHKGKIASRDYFILNPVGVEDCIDLDKSDIQWNALDPEKISACFEMVIDEKRITHGATIFRLKYYPTKVLVKRELADMILAGDFIGIHFIEIEDSEY